MANYSTTFQTKGKYVNVAEAMGIQIESGKSYCLQIIGPAYIQQSEEEPVAGGFLIKKDDPFGYDATATNSLWIKTDKAYFNISD